MPNIFGGEWTEEKLLVMHRYFSGYAQALKFQPFERWYVDAFAGSGQRTKPRFASATPISLFGDDEAEVAAVKEGSVRIALSIEPPFGRYILIEQVNEHAAELRKLRAEYPERAIQILTGEANAALQSLCHATDWRKVRAAVFVDPYGMQVSWTTLEALAATKAVDIALLFPTGPLNRMLAGHGKLPEEWAKRIDDHLGPCDWRSASYEASGVTDLFSLEAPRVEKTITVDGLREFVLSRLRSIFPHVSETQLELRNSRNSVLYHLFIVCANPSARAGEIAMRIARSAMNIGKKRG
jgi:three-Cys-motif partner protein